MDNTWVKLYRKLRQNEVMYKDSTACHVLLWLFLVVDKKTGSYDLGRFVASQELGLNPNTFYKALKRLEKKYQIVTQSSNNRFTTISLLNWAKYNPYGDTVTQSSNNKVTTGEQQSNTKQDNKTIDNKTYIYNHDFLLELQDVDLEEYSKKFTCNKGQVKSEANAIVDYCDQKGKCQYKNHKATLNNWLRRKYGERVNNTPIYYKPMPEDMSEVGLEKLRKMKTERLGNLYKTAKI